MQKYFIDSHLHFDFYPQNDHKSIKQNMQEHNIFAAIIPAIHINNFLTIQKISQKNPAYFYPAYGLHPCFLEARNIQENLSYLDDFLAHNQAIAIGECGLDFYSDIDADLQIKVFLSHIELSNKYKLPLIIHTRKSLEKILQILEKKSPHNFVIHNFSGSDIQLKKIFDLDGFIGIGRSSVYAKALRLQKQLANIPTNRYLLETDAPKDIKTQYSENNPLFIQQVANNLSKIRAVKIEQIVEENIRNSEIFFQHSFT
ncbi:MAG: TatD family hydrolase [Cardiobacteriaceae bacterium]|nr:TatD family hydrolase [Cardiobacteriaceae bacterium]